MQEAVLKKGPKWGILLHMDRLYRPRLGSNSLKGALKGMAQFKGSSLSDRRLKEILTQSGDKDLAKFAYQKGTTSQHEAKKIIQKFARHVKEHKEMSFTMNARRQRIDQVSDTGRVSDIATRNIYDEVAKKEFDTNKPKGPTPHEEFMEKRREERIKMRHLAERQLSELKDKRSKDPLKKEESITSISDKEKKMQAKGDGKDAAPKKSSPGIRMPVMAGGTPRMAPGPDRDFGAAIPSEPLSDISENPQQDPGIPEAPEESGQTAEPAQTQESPDSTEEAPANIERNLPFSE